MGIINLATTKYCVPLRLHRPHGILERDGCRRQADHTCQHRRIRSAKGGFLTGRKKVDNITVKASCKDHGVTKSDSISLGIKASEELELTGACWQGFVIAALALFALLGWVLFGWAGWRQQ
jgi:hypothetical protein